MVAILDADKEGFLRSDRSLIQTIGRAARNENGTVIMYADKITKSMETAISETSRRRKLQNAYNQEHGITPHTVKKSVRDVIEITAGETERTPTPGRKKQKDGGKPTDRLNAAEREKLIAHMTSEMKEAARALEFERAAYLRDEINRIRQEKKG